MQQTADDVKEARDDLNQINRSFSPNLIDSDCGGSYILQKPSHGTIFINGFLHRIRPPTTTLRALLTRRESQTGSLKGVFSSDGSQQIPIRYFGFMANVRPTVPP